MKQKNETKKCTFCGQFKEIKSGVLGDICNSCFDLLSSIKPPETYYPEKSEHVKNKYDITLRAWNVEREKIKQGYFWYRLFGVLPDKKLNAWENKNPKPQQPVLRRFFDPAAELTNRDHTILFIFFHWPTYPPIWVDIRNQVLERDKARCQITGCPSRYRLHVHHKTPIGAGGKHFFENLITLCEFHHALEPGHSEMLGKIRTPHFTIVRGHLRNGSYITPHTRRLRLITLDELNKINEYYAFACPYCNNLQLLFNMDSAKSKIEISCKCNFAWTGPQLLAEESGPQIAGVLIPTKNKGTFEK